MQSFGERLRHERETRNTTIDEIAAATGIHRGFLEALEKNEFQSLPGRAFGKFYLRAYAEILDFDPEPLIVHYDRERRVDPPEGYDRPPDEPTLRRVEASLAKWREARVAARHGGREIVDEPGEEIDDIEVSPPAAEANSPAVGEITQEPVDEPAEELTAIEVSPPAAADVVDAPIATGPNPPAVNEIADEPTSGVNNLAATVGRRRYRILAAAAVVAVVVAVIVVLSRSPEPVPAPTVTAAPPPPSVTEAAPQPQVSVPPTAPPVVRTSKPARPPSRAAAPPPGTDLTVTDFSVARQVAGSRLEAPGDRFREGDVVAFSTRIAGGGSGRSIRHVWLHEGRAVQSIRLRVGGANWGTHSTKTLWGAGAWSVEARDESGKVLARSAFVCDRAAP